MDYAFLIASGPKKCCSCQNDRPCDCGCVCEDMKLVDKAGYTPSTAKKANPSEDCFKALQFNNYNYSDDPGEPTCQDPYADPFIGPKPPCWMFELKDCGDHKMCSEEETRAMCEYPESSTRCEDPYGIAETLVCWECPCDCKMANLAGEGTYFNNNVECEAARLADSEDNPTSDCDKCVEVPFPQGESGDTVCDDLRNGVGNCAGNASCIGQQIGTTCFTIVDKQCSDLGSGCKDNPEVKGIKCDPIWSESDCPALQNCWSSCPNGTFVSEEDCEEWRDDNDDDGCFTCDPCDVEEESNCWCLTPKTCEDNGFYDGETDCDGARVSLGCEGGGGIVCATCAQNDQCSEETDVDCYELLNASCDSIGGSYSTKADCEAGLVGDISNRCYKCERITACDDCWSSNGRTEQCWGVFPKTCGELFGMSKAECDLEVQIAADGPCLKCVDLNCPEVTDCFKPEAKTCVEMGCDEFCDDDTKTEPCPKGISGGRCPECIKCLNCPNGTFKTEGECGEWRDSNDDDSCYKCEPCAADDISQCWCLELTTCSERGGPQYDGATACDNALVSASCEGCATCSETGECSDKGLDCYSINNNSCDSIGGSYDNKADCDAGLIADGSNKCYRCERLMQCDDCWSRDGNNIQCYGVVPKNCTEVGGMSQAECDLEVQISSDGPCLKCTSFDCPETEDCFKLEAKTCVEMGCDEFCDDDQESKKCPEGFSGGKCPDCLTCLGGCAEAGLYAYADYEDCEFDCDAQEDGCGTCKLVLPAGFKNYCWECQQKPCDEMGFYLNCADCFQDNYQGIEHCGKCVDECGGRCTDCVDKTCEEFGSITYDDCVAKHGGQAGFCKRQPVPTLGDPCPGLDCALELDCGVCAEEPPCECCPGETGSSCDRANGCCCCPGGQAPTISGDTCICIADGN